MQSSAKRQPKLMSKKYFSMLLGGTPFDPLAKPDPDILLSGEERGIGGLGILMVKKSIDEPSYEYKDEKNILTIKKELN